MNRLFVYIILAFFFAKAGISQTIFQETIKGAGIGCINQTFDGGFVASGGTISKIDVNGNAQWAKKYLVNNIMGNIYSVIQIQDSGYAAVGVYDSTSNTSSLFILKTDVNGNVQWSKTIYNNPVFTNTILIRQTIDKGYVIAGGTFSNQTGSLQVIKTDSSGNMLWDKLYSQPSTEDLLLGSFIQTKDGGFMMSTLVETQGQTALLKLDSQGNIEWAKMFSDIYGSGYVLQTKDKGYILASSILAKLDSLGNVVWEKMFVELPNHSYIYIANSVVEGSNNGRLIYTHDGGFALLGGNKILVKTDSVGVPQWAKTYKKLYQTFTVIEIQSNESGSTGFIVSADLYNYTTSNYQEVIVKTDVNGSAACDSNIIVIDSLLTPSSTTTLVINVTSGGSLSNITTTTSSVNVTDSVLCSATVGINELKKQNEEISIYPNPSTGIIQISNTSNINELRVSDMLGQTVYEAKPNATNTMLQLDNAGIYFVSITSGAATSTKKVVVNK